MTQLGRFIQPMELIEPVITIKSVMICSAYFENNLVYSTMS